MVEKEQDWLTKYLDQTGVDRIKEAVIKAELTTSSEIVPMLVRRSTLSSEAPMTGALVLLLLTLFALHAYLPNFNQGYHDIIWVLSLVGAGLLGALLGRWSVIERWLIPMQDQRLATERRAMLAFYESGLNGTAGRTGILLFVSFFERRAVVLADQGIAQHFANEKFHEVMLDLVKGAKQQQLAQGFEIAIARCSAMLAQHFPRTDSDKNELKDHLHISW